MSKFNWHRKKPVFYVVIKTEDNPMEMKVLSRHNWHCDAERIGRQLSKEQGKDTFVISTVDWLDEIGN